MFAKGDEGCAGETGEGTLGELVHPRVANAIPQAIVVRHFFELHREDLGWNGEWDSRRIATSPFQSISIETPPSAVRNNVPSKVG